MDLALDSRRQWNVGVDSVVICAQMSGKDPFGCDPFSALRPPPEGSAPPPRPESPSPALPPKKSKQPPPRPAPPRPAQGPKLGGATPGATPGTSPSPAAPTPSPDPSSDPFGSGGGGFADFANFDDKVTSELEVYFYRWRKVEFGSSFAPPFFDASGPSEELILIQIYLLIYS